MRKIFFPLTFLVVGIAIIGCSKTSNQSKELPRIAIAGLAIESSTFSPALTHEEAFHARVGDTILTSYEFLAHDSADYKRANWFPILIGRSLPGGIVTREAYDSLMKKMLDGLKKNLPYDGLFFDIHGAMSVVGLDDPEGDMIVRIREVVGYEDDHINLHGSAWKCFLEVSRK